MVKFYKAIDGIHKYVAEFDNPHQIVKFGSLGYEDYTTHGDIRRKKLYLLRHRKNEDWTNPRTPGALSRWILWNLPSLDDSIDDYVKRFRMHLD
jgi:hypothetical protein